MTTIAVVEDSALIANAVKRILEEEGYTVRTYSDGTTALRGLIDEPVGLAILDLKLADMDGTELLRRLREYSDVPVIVLTGVWTEEPHQIEGFQQGADDYIINL
jgi:two-component system response regulator ChvI